MTRMLSRLSLSLSIAILIAPPAWEARAQVSSLQGAWLEEGMSCGSVFTATGSAVAFKRPASAFAPAFIVSGQRLSTPLASCRIVGVNPSGARQVVNLRCSTTVATDSARAIFAPAEGGMLYRYNAAEGGIATKYQRCSRDALKTP